VCCQSQGLNYLFIILKIKLVLSVMSKIIFINCVNLRDQQWCFTSSFSHTGRLPKGYDKDHHILLAWLWTSFHASIFPPWFSNKQVWSILTFVILSCNMVQFFHWTYTSHIYKFSAWRQWFFYLILFSWRQWFLLFEHSGMPLFSRRWTFESSRPCWGVPIFHFSYERCFNLWHCYSG